MKPKRLSTRTATTRRKRKKGRAPKSPRKSSSNGRVSHGIKRSTTRTITAAEVDSLKEKQKPLPEPTSLTDRLLKRLRRLKGSAPMPENTVVVVINQMLKDRGHPSMSPDIEDLIRFAYQNA